MASQQGENRQLAAAVRRLMLGVDRWRLTVAERYGIDVPGVITLADIHQLGPSTPRMIAHRLAWTTGGVTALLDRLERKGYVTRVPNPADRRSVLIELTAQGREATQWAFGLLEAAVEGPDHPPGFDADSFTAFLEHTSAMLSRQGDHDDPAHVGGGIAQPPTNPGQP